MKTLVFTFVLFLGFTAQIFSKDLHVGDKAPDFTATSVDGTKWNLGDHLGSKNIVVYFYPAAMTGGCTKQACAYRDFSSDLESADALVVGISGDNVEGLKVFRDSYDLNFPLLSDMSGEIAGKFGVPTRDGGTIEREIDGKNVELTRGATASRWTFIIDKEGKVIYKNEDVDASGDPKDVLTFLKNNS
ncbi:peroxiredoxin [Maribellus maritimus]|uniref:peroxiredoxin n=1 Tax=Maribellus maritimus TaxID=2870838 RepID=UPI001EEB1C44|nr:peroxiredoxin [Maribellus maritimus]MCG6187500.1 peroxiredoxin [Maribellus maritimus]